MTVEIRNIGDKIAGRRAFANTAITAGGGGDNTLITGATIDRAGASWANSAVLMIPYTATLGANETFSIACVVQHSEDSGMSPVATLQTVPSTLVIAGPAGGGTVTGCVEIDIPLRGARRYFRCNVTPDLGRAITDTAAISGTLVLAGGERLPA